MGRGPVSPLKDQWASSSRDRQFAASSTPDARKLKSPESDPPKRGYRVVPFCPFSFWAAFLKPNSRKRGILIIKGLLRNLVNWVLVQGLDLSYHHRDL